MAFQVDELVKSNNNLVRAIAKLNEEKVVERAVEAHYMMSTICQLLVDKNLCTAEEIQSLSEKLQTTDLGLVDKPDKTVAEGDTILMKFKLFDGDTLVDDQWEAPLAYTVGSKGLPFDDAMMGMVVGEQRMITTKFGQGFKFKEYIDKPLTVQLACFGVKMIKKKDETLPPMPKMESPAAQANA